MAIAPTITYSMFKGAVLLTPPHLLSEGDAHRAVDVHFENGVLKPFFDTSLELQTDASIRTIFLHECCWIQTTTCASFAEGSATCNEIYATGVSPFPVEGRVDEETCAVTWRRLGLPCPPAVLTAEVIADTDVEKDVEGRSYAYAYRSSTGFTSQLSAGSVVQLIRDGATVRVTGWDVPSPEWDVTEIVIYRTVSGALSGQAPGAVKLDTNQPDTYWMEVGVVPVTATQFIDSRWNEELTNAYVAEMIPPPPAELEGIGSIDSMNVLFGFVGRELYFSKNNEPNAWPHRFTLDDNIKAVIESGGFIYVATDGFPYILSATDDCQHAGCRQILKAQISAPMAGFGNKRMAAVQGGAVYPSKHGLVQVNSQGQVRFISQGILSQQQWEEMIPDTVVPVQYEGKLFVFGLGKSFVFYISQGPEQAIPFAGVSELSDRVIAAFVSRQGFLYLHKENGVWRWEGSATKRKYLWESLELRASFGVGYGVIRPVVSGGGASVFTFIVNDEEMFSFDCTYTSNYMIPTYIVGERWRVRIEGDAEISSFSMAQDKSRLRL